MDRTYSQIDMDERRLERTRVQILRDVLRESPVLRPMSRIHASRAMPSRRMMLKSPLWITPLPGRKPPWEKTTWHNSQ